MTRRWPMKVFKYQLARLPATLRVPSFSTLPYSTISHPRPLMVLNKLASSAHLFNLAGEAHGKQLAKLGGHNLRGADVPKAKFLVCIAHCSLARLPYELPVPQPHITLMVEGGSLKARCSALLNANLQGLEPGQLFTCKVKRTKDDPKHLFNHASQQHRVEPPDSIFMEPERPTVASNLLARSLDPSSSPSFTVPTFSDEDDYRHSLIPVAHSWLLLLSRHRTLIDPTNVKTRHDFCQALSQYHHALCSLIAGTPVFRESRRRNRTTFCFPGLFPGFLRAFTSGADNDWLSGRGRPNSRTKIWSNLSSHSSEKEEWTLEVESRKQDAFNKTLSGLKIVGYPRSKALVLLFRRLIGGFCYSPDARKFSNILHRCIFRGCRWQPFSRKMNQMMTMSQLRSRLQTPPSAPTLRQPFHLSSRGATLDSDCCSHA